MRTCAASENASGDSFLGSCGQGVHDFFSTLYEGTVGSFQSQAERMAEENRQKAAFEKACEEDHSLAIKRSLEISARLEGVTRPLTDADLKNRSCASLIQAAKARDNFRQFQDYVNKLDSPEFRTQWDEARKRAFQTLKDKVIAEFDKAGVILQCYTPEAQTEMGCKVATALVAGVVVNRTMMSVGSALDTAPSLEISKTEDSLYKATQKAPGSWHKLTVDQARAIIGDDAKSSTEKFRRAMAYIKTRQYPSAADKASDIETLFNDIQSHEYDWDYRRLKGSDGSSVFVGDAGYAVVVDPRGKMYRGSIDYKYFDTGKTWQANYKDLDPVP